ncbi:MAG: ATP-dependent helicase HrpB [Desulfovibrio sp.]|nr:ATP-dependent helicase HrpB [Desulfovibrio sp.]
MPSILPNVPLDAMRSAFLERFKPGARLALTAPAGSGKSSRVPLWLREAGFCRQGRILLLEPRRLAAHALAQYLARLLGEELGCHIGLRMHGLTRTSQSCEIEVVTEGVLTRMLLADPELCGISCVIFDEFHERSLACDLGFTLLCDIQKALRRDLVLLLMSATFEREALATKLRDFTQLSFDVQGFPVQVSWLEPERGIVPGSQAFWQYTASVICRAAHKMSGTILVFLPGAAEIARVAEYLASEPACDVPCYALTRHSPRSVREAIFQPRTSSESRIVLATSVAESSVTIPGVVCVVDSGLARRQVHDPGQGLDRLVTVPEARASMLQRTGRAGRTAQGVCLRLFSKAQANDFPESISPEILRSDLAGLVLVLAAMGVVSYQACLALPWLDAPPQGSFARARSLLQTLGALDAKGQITALGQKLTSLPLAPRTGLLVLRGLELGLAELACLLAALIDNFSRLAPKTCDITALLEDISLQPAGSLILNDALRLAHSLGLKPRQLLSKALASKSACGQLLLEAWPDFLAMRLSQANTQASSQQIGYKLRGGHVLELNAEDPSARAAFLVVPCVLGKAPRERIRLCAAVDHAQLERLAKDLCQNEDEIQVGEDGCVHSYLLTRLDALELARKVSQPSASQCRKALLQHLTTTQKLPLGSRARAWQQRVLFLHEELGEPWPDLSDAKLLGMLDEWLGPLLEDAQALVRLTDSMLMPHFCALLPYRLHALLDTLAPAFWVSPAGVQHAVHYEGYHQGRAPWVEVKLQECFGLLKSPTLAQGKIPLTLQLLSPAGRPLQITSDLAHFWSHGYRMVRGEMLGRYPKHPWPEDPTKALPTAHAKKRRQKL